MLGRTINAGSVGINFISEASGWLVFHSAMNAQVRRIDLVCKLIGPFFTAVIDSLSTKAVIPVNLGMNVCSVIVGYFSIAKVRSN